MSDTVLQRTYLTSHRDYAYEPSAILPNARNQSPITTTAVNALLEGIRRGLSRPAAAARAGLPISVLELTMGRGLRIATQRPEAIYAQDWEAYQLFVEVGRAESDLELQQVEKWLVNGAADWTSQRDFLSRRFPETWSSSSKVDVNVVKRMGNEDLLLLIQTLMADMTAPPDPVALLEEVSNTIAATDEQPTEVSPGTTGSSTS